MKIIISNIKDAHEKKSSCISRCLQYIERSIIESVYTYLESWDINISKCIYCFDGFLFPKDEISKIIYSGMNPKHVTERINSHCS